MDKKIVIMYPQSRSTLESLITNNEAHIKNCGNPIHDKQQSIFSSQSTGFGVTNSLDINYSSCTEKILNQPLYKENFLSEFKTEDEKRWARNQLGLYNEKDVVAMSLLTTDQPSSIQNVEDIVIKALQQGKVQFAPQTVAEAVAVKNKDKISNLQDAINKINSDISLTQLQLQNLLNPSSPGSKITTPGDAVNFLSGYQNNQTLKDIVKEYLIFEKIEQL